MTGLAMVGAVLLTVATRLATLAPPQPAAASQPLRVLVVDTGSGRFISSDPAVRTGFDREILDAFAELERRKLEIVPVPGWDQLIPALLAGKGDVIAGTFTLTEERSRQVAFTGETFPVRYCIVTRKPAPPIRTLEALRKASVGVVKGSVLRQALLDAGVPPGRIVELPTGGSWEALTDGRANAYITGVEHALPELLERPELEMGLFVGAPSSFAYAVRKEDAELHRALSGYVANLRRTATWNRLVVKYFGARALEILKAAREEP
jgi:ABC-type amino acid transport substrate-binding protein